MMQRQRAKCAPSLLRKLPLTQLIIAGLSVMAVPTDAFAQSYLNEYRVCAAELLDAGVSADQAAIACGEALEPDELSLCVLRINYQTQVAGPDVLDDCFRVRQPVELANCVVRINRNASDAVAVNLIDYCRRSLRPAEYSQCVSGLLRRLDISTAKAMDSCISAEDYPNELFPTFAPPPPSQPTPQLIPEVTPTLPQQAPSLPQLTPAPPPTPVNPTTP